MERCVAVLARQGYRLALGDHKLEEKWEPLLPYVEIVKGEMPAVEMEAHHLAIAASGVAASGCRERRWRPRGSTGRSLIREFYS